MDNLIPLFQNPRRQTCHLHARDPQSTKDTLMSEMYVRKTKAVVREHQTITRARTRQDKTRQNKTTARSKTSANYNLSSDQRPDSKLRTCLSKRERTHTHRTYIMPWQHYFQFSVRPTSVNHDEGASGRRTSQTEHACLHTSCCSLG